jgi:hypothetical protein
MAELLKTPGVYALVVPSGAMYIGASANIRRRFHQHTYMLRNKIHHATRLQEAWSAQGERIECRVLVACAAKDMLMYEQIAMDAFTPEMNTSATAVCMHDPGIRALAVQRRKEVIASRKAAGRDYGRALRGTTKPVAVRELLSQRTKEAFADPDIREKYAAAKRGKPSNARKSVLCVDTNEVFDSATAAAAKHGCSMSAIANAAAGKSKTSVGLRWAYIQSPLNKDSECL